MFIVWIYMYIRADGEEIDMGPFKTREEAETALKKHASFGALTTGPIEKPDDHKLFKG